MLQKGRGKLITVFRQKIGMALIYSKGPCTVEKRPLHSLTSLYWRLIATKAPMVTTDQNPSIPNDDAYLLICHRSPLRQLTQGKNGMNSLTSLYQRIITMKVPMVTTDQNLSIPNDDAYLLTYIYVRVTVITQKKVALSFSTLVFLVIFSQRFWLF